MYFKTLISYSCAYKYALCRNMTTIKVDDAN